MVINIISRGVGFEEIMDSLVTRITGIEHFKHHTGCSYSNDIFSINPYYFGKCLCKYSKTYDEYLKTNPHKPNCFTEELKILNEAFKSHPLYHNANKLKAVRANEERKLCLAHKLEYNDGKNLDLICNCGAKKIFLENNPELKHEEGCPKIIPNFLYKPENISINWYKTYFRDATSNVFINKEKFTLLITECLKSL